MSDRNFGAVRTAAEFVDHARRLIRDGTPIGFDIEAGYVGEDKEGVSLLPHHPDWILVGFSFTNSKHWARYVPIAHDIGGNVDDVKAVARVLWRVLNTGLAVAHNAKYELAGVSRWFMETLGDDPKVGEEVRAVNGFFPIRSCTMNEAKLIQRYDPIRIGHGLKALSKNVLGQEMTEFTALFPVEDTEMGPGTRKNKKRFIRFNTRNSQSTTIIEYACEDSTAALELHELHYPELKDQFITKIENELLPNLVEMEFEALVLDWKSIDDKANEVSRFRDLMNEEIQKDFTQRTGNPTPVLLSSPKQLADVLFKPIADGGLGLPIKKRSDKTQAPSTSEEALRVIAQSDPIIRKILKWREVAKLYGSYLDKYRRELHYHPSGRAFPNHNQIGAGTGRMSVDGFPYQQLPKPQHWELDDGTSFDINMRDIVSSPDGFRIIGFDYSQIELRILAGQAHETAMIEAFTTGVDIHRQTASTMLRIPVDEITHKQRQVGKTGNFAVVYQSGAANVAEMLTGMGTPTTTEEAEQMLKDYYAAFPKLRAWMDDRVLDGKQQGYVETLFKRRFRVFEFENPNSYIRSKGDRLCINAPIQGGAADYMKIGLIRAVRAIKKAGLADKIRLVMSIHDALEFYVHKSVTTQEVIDLIGPQVAFDHPLLGGVPIRADWHEGYRWGHVVDVKRGEDGKITGWEVEDDDVLNASLADALARFEVIDAEKAAKLTAQIAERVAARAPKQESVEDALAETVDPIIVAVALLDAGLESAEILARHERRKGVEADIGARVEAALEPDADTPSEDVKIALSERESEDTPMALLPTFAPPAPDPRDGLTSKQHIAYHRESALGQSVEDWLTETGQTRGVDKPDPTDGDEPPWLHTPAFAGSEVRIVLTEMPTKDDFAGARAYINSRKGTNRITLETPKGSVEWKTKQGITETDQAELSRMLGGVTILVTKPPEAVTEDAEELDDMLAGM